MTLNANDKWNKLLHYDNGENLVVSKEFFLSEHLNPNPEEELVSTIKYLNSSVGEEVACNYPARYNFLKKNEYKIPKYDLNKCIDLMKFYDSFEKDKLNIVFTSEYNNNPSSAFGHAMILFTNENQNIETGDIIHFAAKTSNEDGFFKYSYNGITGKYKGYFLREQFFKKIYEYNVLEQRYMYVYELDYTKEQIKELIFHLYELRKAEFKYYFFDGNCASQASKLINLIEDIKMEKKSFYLPIDSIISQENRIERVTVFMPLINKLFLLIREMTTTEREIFFSIVRKNSQIQKHTPDIVKEALVNYSIFNFRKYRRVFKNYNDVMTQVYKKTSIDDIIPNPLEKVRPSNIEIGMSRVDNSNYLLFKYRPLFISLDDIQQNYMAQSEVEFLNFNLLMKSDKLKVDKIGLINIKSLPNHFKYYRPLNWSFYSGLNRRNKESKLKYSNELGLGKSMTIFKFNTFVLLNVGFDNIEPYIKPFIYISKNITSELKVSSEINYKQNRKGKFISKKLFFSLKEKNIFYNLSLENSSFIGNNVSLSLKYNF